MTTGLTWDEAVAVFGLAAKATEQAAARMGAGTPARCVTLAHVRFEDAFSQDVRVVVSVSGAPQRHEGSADHSLPATAHRRQIVREPSSMRLSRKDLRYTSTPPAVFRAFADTLVAPANDEVLRDGAPAAASSPLGR